MGVEVLFALWNKFDWPSTSIKCTLPKINSCHTRYSGAHYCLYMVDPPRFTGNPQRHLVFMAWHSSSLINHGLNLIGHHNIAQMILNHALDNWESIVCINLDIHLDLLYIWTNVCRIDPFTMVTYSKMFNSGHMIPLNCIM